MGVVCLQAEEKKVSSIALEQAEWTRAAAHLGHNKMCTAKRYPLYLLHPQVALALPCFCPQGAKIHCGTIPLC